MSYEVNKYGFDFNGASHLTINNPIVDNRYITLMATIERDALGVAHTIIRDSSSLSGSLEAGVRLEINSDNKIRFVANFSTTTVSYWLWSSSDTIDLTTKNISVVADAQNKTCIFYINGIASTSVNYGEQKTSYHQATFEHTNPSLYIGVYQSSTLQKYFNGVIYDIKVFNSELSQAQIQSEMTSDNITAVGHWTLNQTLDDSSPNNNDATVTGVEQYAIIGTETVYGTKCTKTETFEQDANDTFDELIYDWFYGGTIKIEVDNLAWKTIKILAYDDESNSYLPIKVETTTLREHTIVIPKTATRRLKLSIDSDSTFTTVVYTLESVFDVINDTDSNSSGAVAIDYNMIYSDVNIEKRSMSFRVNDDDAHFAQSIL
ncbi:MAG: LamG domain-containing protein, partial [Colwellia sp.]|nr:LamG domain-containing protein [Colwellia sp.]